MSTVDREIKTPIPSGFTQDEWDEILADRFRIQAEVAAMPKSNFVPPKPRVDADGRLAPISDEEWAKRISTMIEEFKMMPNDDPTAAHEEAMRGIDEERRRLGMRTLFDGIYRISPHSSCWTAAPLVSYVMIRVRLGCSRPSKRWMRSRSWALDSWCLRSRTMRFSASCFVSGRCGASGD